MPDEPRPLLYAVLLVGVVLLTEYFGPKIGPWALWSGRIVAGAIVTFMVYMAWGGGGAGRFILATILVFGLGALWFGLSLGDALMRGLDSLARIVIPILVVVDVVSAFVDIIAGFRTGRNGLIIAGALAGLMGLASAPAVEEPTGAGLVMSVLGMIVGVGAFFREGAQRAFD